MKPKLVEGRKLIKIRGDINEIEIIKIIKRIIETKSWFSEKIKLISV